MSFFSLPTSILAATSTLAQISPSFIWLLGGAILCLMELFVPTAFVELAMGISAFFVAIIALVIPHLGLQVLLWMVFSLVLVFLTRRLLPKRSHSALQESMEAQTLTEIAPGKTGRVIFEGNSWQAKCESDRAIGPDEKVIVVGRSGNTLFVLPDS
ncbi:NfeD family protein [Oscillatoriales cyanobacterium LEGE 11467]|uniref:NfeD family protein n=1 Tax=Zarconia navalis LEGE 11467 TaxID=1828826 RepID=A0A928VYT0_9CYAN|nr:NfeD family protein [Zarconia navalis]MBE9042784.1 NfeD family protein [Zarconia navalis LEGE 11467]